MRECWIMKLASSRAVRSIVVEMPFETNLYRSSTLMLFDHCCMLSISRVFKGKRARVGMVS